MLAFITIFIQIILFVITFFRTENSLKNSLNALVLLNKRNALFYWISNLDIQKLITLYLTLLGDNDISCNENISLFHFVQNFFCKVMSFKNMNSSNFTASSSIIKHVRVQMMYLQLVKS